MERPEPITVTALNKYIKNIVDNDEFLGMVYIRGEISNFKSHYTGHLYFTLKDETSLIKCVMFKTYTSNLNFTPKDGMSVVILGSVSVFERDGIYQIYVKGMEMDGVGALYAEYEKLKSKLAEEGLFDENKKKRIPMLPKSIGVITSKTGAVIRDIINVTTRRFPNVNIKLYYSSVNNIYFSSIQVFELIASKFSFLYFLTSTLVHSILEQLILPQLKELVLSNLRQNPQL